MSHCCLSLFESYLNHLDPLGKKMWFYPKWPALYNHFTQEEMPFQHNFQGFSCWTNEVISHTSCFTLKSYCFPELVSSELFLTFDHGLAVWPVTVKLNVMVVQWLQGADAETYKTEMTDVLSNHSGWQNEMSVLIFQQVWKSVSNFCEHEDPKGKKCKMWFQLFFEAFEIETVCFWLLSCL